MIAYSRWTREVWNHARLPARENSQFIVVRARHVVSSGLLAAGVFLVRCSRITAELVPPKLRRGEGRAGAPSISSSDTA